MSYHIEVPRSGFKELPDRILVREDGYLGAYKFYGEPIVDYWYVPEQDAPQATLGRWECHIDGYDDGEDELLDGTWVYRVPTWHLSCGHEVHGTHRPCFCPRCGRRIKEV